MNTQLQFAQNPVAGTESFFRHVSALALKIQALQKPTFEELQVKFAWIHSVEHDKSWVKGTFVLVATVEKV